MNFAGAASCPPLWTMIGQLKRVALSFVLGQPSSHPLKGIISILEKQTIQTKKRWGAPHGNLVKVHGWTAVWMQHSGLQTLWMLAFWVGHAIILMSSYELEKNCLSFCSGNRNEHSGTLECISEARNRRTCFQIDYAVSSDQLLPLWGRMDVGGAFD